MQFAVCDSTPDARDLPAKILEQGGLHWLKLGHEYFCRPADLAKPVDWSKLEASGIRIQSAPRDAGVADPGAGIIVLPTFDWERTPPSTLYQTLRHELAHVALQRYLGAARTPRWFTEGYAQWAAGEWDWDSAWRLRLAILGGRAPPLDSLTLEWPVAETDARIAYLLAASAVSYLVDSSGERGLRIFLRRWRDEVDFDRAFRATYGVTLGQFEEDWRKHVRDTYGWPVLLTHSLVLWLVAAILLLLLYAVRRRRDRAKLARLRATEPPDDPAFWDPPR